MSSQNQDPFEFQLEVLKGEITHIGEAVRGIDEITQQIKNWTILIWAGSLSIVIGSSNNDFRKLIFASAIVPFLFWIIDGFFRRRQRRILFRQKKIAEFLQSSDFELSFKQRKLVNFTLLDITGKQYPQQEVGAFSSIKRTMWFKSMRAFYLGLILTTLLLQALLYPYNGPATVPPQTSERQMDSTIISNQQKTIQELISLLKAKDSSGH